MTVTFTVDEQRQIDDMVRRIETGEMRRELFVAATDQAAALYKADPTPRRHHELMARQIVEVRTKPAYNEAIRREEGESAVLSPPPTPTRSEGQAQLTKRIGEYRDGDYPVFICFEDGSEELIGYRKTHRDAALLGSDYIIRWYSENHTPEKAAGLIMDELAQEGRHEQFAKDQGLIWNGEPVVSNGSIDRWREIGEETEQARIAVLLDEADQAPLCGGAGCEGCLDCAGDVPPELFAVAHAAMERALDEAVARMTAAPSTPIDPPSLTTMLDLDGEVTFRTHKNKEKRDEYLKANPAASIAFSVIDPPPPQTVKVVRTECARCGIVNLCIDGVCTDREGCEERAEYRHCRNCGGDHHIQRCPEIGAALTKDDPFPAELPIIRAAYRSAMADNCPITAESIVSHALCEAERYVREA